MTTAKRRVAQYNPAFAADETFARRLEEARAFGLASEGLASRHPEFSAKSGLTIAQRLTGWACVGALAFGLIANATVTLACLEIGVGCLFGLIIALRIMATLRAALSRPAPPDDRMPDHQLEVITYLAPLKDETSVVPALIDAIARLDYPRHKLDVKLLVEADDEQTLAAVMAAGPPAWFEIVPIPPGAPRTKPKALNYGMKFARGSIIAVLDAEDRPSPDQPRAAAGALRSGSDRLAVVQAPLAIHNGADGWLARQFEVEYAIHFRVWLPFLAWLRLPLALGGTSNYFDRKWLERAGGWDAWNVTEDADIGLRLARLGADAKVIAAPTREEAPARLRPWLNQRTRWMKGHLQTWLVLMRQPLKAARGMGISRFAATQLTFGGALLASVLHAPLLAWIVASAFLFRDFEAWHVALFSLGYGSVVVAAFFARAKHADVWTLLSLPLYWPLLSFAMLAALIDMKRRPHFWAKTPHGSTGKMPVAHVPERLADNVIQLEFPFEEARERT